MRELTIPERWVPVRYRSAWRKRIRVRPTREGWWFLLLLLGLTLASFNTGNNLLYLVLSLLLAVLVIQNVVAEWNLRGVVVRRQLPAELFAWEGAVGALEVVNKRRLGASFDIRVEERGPVEAGGLVGLVPAGAAVAAPATWTFARRGVSKLGVLRVSSAFPFGLFLRYRDFDHPVELLVYPPRRAGRPARAAAGLGQEVEDPRRRGGEGDFIGLRPYTPGDPLRALHARTWARVGQPMVMERAAHQATQVMVRVPGRPGQLEDELARACGQAVRHFALGHAVGLEIGGRVMPPRSGGAWRKTLLTTLATAEAPP